MINQSKFARWAGLLAVVTCLFLVLVGCPDPLVTKPQDKGSIAISFGNNINARSLQPTIDMTAANYTITGTGPGGATFTASSTGAAVTQNGLAFGTWTIVVNATNAAGDLIGTGTSTVQVNTGSTTTVSISVTPIAGTGTLSLGVTWPAAQVQAPSIVASLTPALGAAQTLPFAIAGSTGSYSNSSVGNGYYTLAFTLRDTGIVVAGAVDVVRIVAGQITSGTYAFANVNAPGGNIQVNIDTDLQNPLDVAIAGATATKPQNQSLSLSASVSNYSQNVSYVWYVNGSSVGTGATFAFDSTWAQGYYRIDVTGFSADGTRAGSATADVQVVGAVVTTTTTSTTSTSSTTTTTVTNSGLPLTMVNVPAGRFQRDATATNISVITQPFRMSATEITRAQFAALLTTDPSNATYSSGTSDPVQMTNWYHAIAFCNKLSLAEGLIPVYAVTGVNFSTLTYASIPNVSNATWDAATATWTNNGYRLPTEMEWMWAAMGAPSDGQGGGTNTTGYLKGYAGSTEGSGQTNLISYAWYQANSDTRTHPAGTKTANELGLYDMSGNVEEWCWDWFAGSWPDYDITGIQTDYRGGDSGNFRVFRGGAWNRNASACTVALRGATNPYVQHSLAGFRVVRP